jgi:uncharacterized alpha-E superfamily protein
VARFLVVDPIFPRSVRFALRAAVSRFERLRPPDQADLPGARSAARLTALASWVAALEKDFDVAGLHELLTHVVDETAAIAGVIGTELLGYAPTPPAEMSAQ